MRYTTATIATGRYYLTTGRAAAATAEALKALASEHGRA